MYHALKSHGTVDFDCIVPIPLSPDKCKRGEIHRTLLLATELGRLLGTPVREWLTLDQPISKRWCINVVGLTARQFERKYYDLLNASNLVRGVNRILLVDDLATTGSTLSCAADSILEKNTNAKISAVTAGQMILRSVVRQAEALRA